MRQTSFIRPKTSFQADLLIVPLYEGEPIPQLLENINHSLGGGVKFNIEREKFSAKPCQKLLMTTNGKHSIPNIMLVGLGKRDGANELHLQECGGNIAALLADTAYRSVAIETSEYHSDDALNIVFGMWLRRWTFDKYITEKKEPFQLIVITDGKNDQYYRSLYQGVALARELTVEPANVLYPDAYAERCEALRDVGLEIHVLDENELEKIGARTLLAVGSGSCNGPRMVTLQWRGGDANQPTIALVGKGVCFDAGGINIKTDHLIHMKMDKAGAGTVVGVLYALAIMRAQVNVVGIIGLAENMPDGKALKPGDVICTLSGKTVEVYDTDNEGRLILADCLWYAAERFSPQKIVDLATLTLETFGALADEYAGLFSEDVVLSQELLAAGLRSGEKLWQLPMGEAYAKQITSSVADIKNIGVLGFGESSATAEFLKCFVPETISWAHLDIAGVAWTQDDKPLCSKGVTGWGVRLLVNWILGKS